MSHCVNSGASTPLPESCSPKATKRELLAALKPVTSLVGAWRAQLRENADGRLGSAPPATELDQVSL
jgi:hypothetical protein